MAEIVWTELKDAEVKELFTGIRVRRLWKGENGAKAIIFEIDPGGCYEGIDLHKPGPEEVYDGECQYG